MFQPWRIKLREVEEAMKSGRLDDASRLLFEGDLRQYYPAQKLVTNLAGQIVDRGRTRVAKGETSAGWHDLEAAEKLGADAAVTGTLRRQLIEQALAEAERLLAAGSCQAALATLDKLENRGGAGQDTRQFKTVVRKFDEARSLVRRGKFTEAQEALAVASGLRPDLPCLEQAARECQQKGQQGSLLQETLHRQLSEQSWPEVLHTADQMLQRSPDWHVALDARRKAWAHVGMQVTGTGPARRLAATDAVAAESLSPALAARFLLWIDGVGGYLVCEGDEVVIGQPAMGGQVDVPILGDISRQHGRIHRRGEDYLLQPLRKTKVGGRVVEGWHTLADGQLLELGEGVQIRFRRPHALSTTARLEFASRHRTQPATDAVLLMGESVILGSAPNCHVCCAGFGRQIVIYRQDGELWCRIPGPFQIDGRSCEDEGRITRCSQIVGEDFSMSLEELTH